MKLLIIGSGGREHAIAKKCLADPQVTRVFCAPGNSGMQQDGIELVAIAETDHQLLIEFAIEHQVAWTFVGPEVPLLNGIVDDFQAAGLQIFGPSKQAAMIEGSKAFAKEIMETNQIPTAAYRSFTDSLEAKAYIAEKGAPIVIKADGLAAGKGVVVATTVEEALDAVTAMLEQNRFGDSGAKVVVEDFLAGEEFSLLAFVNENKVYPMVIAQDHKRAYDHDLGPNTGGMGAYSPVPQISQDIVDQAIREVLHPAAQGMIDRGTPFVGILYAGLIATDEGPKVIEFNARFGDPETQVVLNRLDSSLPAIISALLANQEPDIVWNDRASIGVVLAAEGYPKAYQTGSVVPTKAPKTAQLYYAGVADDDQNGLLTANGGRVMLVEVTASDLASAQIEVYRVIDGLSLDGLFYRRDIGDKALRLAREA